MKFAAFSGVLMDYSIHDAMRMTKDLGMDGIEIAVREPHLSSTTSIQRRKEMKRIADSYGLEIPVIAGYMGGFSDIGDDDCEKAFDEFKQVLEYADEFGGYMIRVQPGGPNAFLAHEYHYLKSAYWLNRCAEEAMKHQVKILLEIHNHSLVETVDSSFQLLNLIDHKNIGMIHDAGNMFISDTDYGRESVLKLGERLFHVHVKDEKRVYEDEASAPGTFTSRTRRGVEQFRQCLLGEGEANHQPLFDSLVETGYEGWVTLECWAPFEPFERLEHDFRKVRKMLQGKKVDSI